MGFWNRLCQEGMTGNEAGIPFDTFASAFKEFQRAQITEQGLKDGLSIIGGEVAEFGLLRDRLVASLDPLGIDELRDALMLHEYGTFGTHDTITKIKARCGIN